MWDAMDKLAIKKQLSGLDEADFTACARMIALYQRDGGDWTAESATAAADPYHVPQITVPELYVGLAAAPAGPPPQPPRVPSLPTIPVPPPPPPAAAAPTATSPAPSSPTPSSDLAGAGVDPTLDELAQYDLGFRKVADAGSGGLASFASATPLLSLSGLGQNTIASVWNLVAAQGSASGGSSSATDAPPLARGQFAATLHILKLIKQKVNLC